MKDESKPNVPDPKHAEKPVYERPRMIDLVELDKGHGVPDCAPSGSSAAGVCSTGGIAAYECQEGGAAIG